MAELFPCLGEGGSIELLARAVGEGVVDVDVFLIIADEQYGVLVLGGVDWAVGPGPGDPIISRFELARDPGDDWGTARDVGEDVVEGVAGEVDCSSWKEVLGELGEGSVVDAVADPVSVAGDGTDEIVVWVAPAHDVAKEVAMRAEHGLRAIGGLLCGKGQLVHWVPDRGEEHREAGDLAAIRQGR